MTNRPLILVPGTFLPVTKAHIAIGTEAQKLIPGALVMYVPSNVDFMKNWKNVSSFITGEERMSLLRGALEPYGFEASPIEADGTVSGRTIDTVEYFRRQGYTDITICFGADKIGEMERWYRAEELLRENRFIFLSRDKSWQTAEKESALERIPHHTLLEMPEEYLGVSSTEIRKAFEEGELERVRNILPENVYNYLEKRMNSMDYTYKFDAEKTTAELVQWIKDWFDENGRDCKAVIGISGGKDSTVVAGLMVKALGKERVVGVMMPNGTQYDISDSYHVCEFLDIEHYEINIKDAYDGVLAQLDKCGITPTKQTLCNLPPRLRMSTLYAVSQSMNGRVINTCNLSETMVSWETRWGDAVGDVSPLATLTVQEVKQIGKVLGLPIELVDKAPADGLCGSTDEDALGVKYLQIDECIRLGATEDKTAEAEVRRKYKNTMFKRLPIPFFESGMHNYLL